MKRFFVGLVLILFLFSLVGCSPIMITTNDNAVLKYDNSWKRGHINLTQTLTAEETRVVKDYLTSAEYTPGAGGCPFSEKASITFGDQIFAFSQDGCHGIWIIGTDRYYSLSDEGYNYIVSLFEKYAGEFL